MPDERSLAGLAEEVRREQGRRWRAGDRVVAEVLFAENPRLSRDDDAALGLVYSEILLGEERGESPSLEEYASRFPKLAARLGPLFEVHRALESSRFLEPTDFDTPVPGPDGLRPHRLSGLVPTVKGYEILGELGRGGMGVVYRARQYSLGREVALKMILAGHYAGATQVARFQTEAEAVARLQHPNIVQIHDVGDEDGRPFLALELVEGGSLADDLDGVPRSAISAASSVRTLALAMQAAHLKGIVHRDLKPSNILLTPDGTLKITDFGLAKLLGADMGLTQTESIMGSPSYMAPEQARGGAKQVGPAADIHALGAILYELLTGRPPFRAESTLETLELVRSSEPVPPGRLLPRLSPDLETICLKCLEKEPARRYASAGELAEELDRFLRDEPILARPIRRVERLLRRCRRNPVLTAASGLAALALAATVAVSLVFGITQTRTARALAAVLEESRRLSARSTFRNGVALCEQGDVDRGVLWIARSLVIAEQTNQADLRHAIRVNLTGWTRRLHPLRHCLEHQKSVRAIAFSPDGLMMATGGEDGIARLWDAATGHPMSPPLSHSETVASLVFSPDGRTLFTVGKSGSVALWSTPSGSEIVPAPKPNGPPCYAALSPDGALVVTGTVDGAVRFRDTRTGKASRHVLHHAGPIRVAAFGPGVATVLTGSDDGTAILWDLGTGRPLHSFAHGSPVLVAAHRPDGKMLVTGAEDGTARLWDATTGRAVGGLLRHDARVEAVSFSPDGRRILTSSRDWKARLWDSATGTLIGAPMRHQAPVLAGAFSADGRRVITGSLDGTARVWNCATTLPIGPPILHQGFVASVGFSPDGRFALTAGSSPVAKVWKLAAAEPQPTLLAPEGRANCMALSPDGRLVALDSGGPTAWIHDLSQGRQIGAPLRHDDDIQALAFNRAGTIVASCGDDHTARLWDAATGRSIGVPLTHREKIESLVFSPDDGKILTSGRSGLIRLWDVSTGRPLGERRCHAEPVSALAFSPDGGKFLTGSADQTAGLWDASTLEPISVPLRHQGRVWAVAFDPTGRVAATAGDDKTLKFWDAVDGTPLGSPMIDHSPIRSVVFGPDGRNIFVGSSDGTSRLWNVATREPLGPPLQHRDRVLAARFDPPSSRIVIGLENRTTRIHDVPPPMAGDINSITLSIEVGTNMEIDLNGGVQLLSLAEWRGRFLRLEALGGERWP